MKFKDLKEKLDKLESEYLDLIVEIENHINGETISTYLIEVSKDGLLKAADTPVSMDEELPKIYKIKEVEAIERYVVDQLGICFYKLIERPWGIVWSYTEKSEKFFTRYAGRNIKTVSYTE